MKLFDWFKPKDKHNVVVPSENVGPLQGVELIVAFSNDSEPKVVDFPKDKYKAYWETYIDAIPGGYAALVRFYSFSTGQIIKEFKVAKQSVTELKMAVNNAILSTMEENKR